MRFIDTHAHIYSSQFDADREAMLRRTFAAGVTDVFMPNVDSESVAGMMDLEARYPSQCHAMMGVHPCSIAADFEQELALAEEWLRKRPFVAVGEIGLDYYWSTEFVA
ncbi:MAG: TatD family hydrolase, partial [Cytophagales bacterium]|nr:TatD family hydrolase [Cytophagales bacterium]